MPVHPCSRTSRPDPLSLTLWAGGDPAQRAILTHPAQEGPAGVMDGPHSVIFDEAESRLLPRRAIMLWRLGI